jgi:hypothetical protein
MRVTNPVSNLSLASGTSNSDSFTPSFIFDEDGVVQMGTATAGTGTIRVQGRLSASAPWVDITLTSAGATSHAISTTTSAYYLVPLFPHMRVQVTASSSITGLNVWFGA